MELILRLKKRQFDAIDHNVKPKGECAYYSILMGILYAEAGKPKNWQINWQNCEKQMNNEVLAEIKQY